MRAAAGPESEAHSLLSMDKTATPRFMAAKSQLQPALDAIT